MNPADGISPTGIVIGRFLSAARVLITFSLWARSSGKKPLLAKNTFVPGLNVSSQALVLPWFFSESPRASSSPKRATVPITRRLGSSPALTLSGLQSNQALMVHDKLDKSTLMILCLLEEKSPSLSIHPSSSNFQRASSAHFIGSTGREISNPVSIPLSIVSTIGASSSESVESTAVRQPQTLTTVKSRISTTSKSFVSAPHAAFAIA